MSNQKYTSANTSINCNQLPTAFSKYTPYGYVMDYGCGKFINMIKLHCNENGAKYFPYDKYNQDEGTNKATLLVAKRHGFDKVYCCNVLNVIDDESEIWNILYNIFQYCNNHGTIIIQIYEGNKSGIGKATKKDCYQRNEKTEEYTKYFGAFQGAPFTWERHSNIIVVTKH